MNESNLVKKLLTVSAIFVLGIATITSAATQVDDEGHEIVRVSYGDLDVSKDAGVRVLYARIKGAADRACGGRSTVQEAGSLEAVRAYKKCYDSVSSKLVAKANNTELSKLHAG